MDTTYGVPVGFYVTGANESDYKNLIPLVQQVQQHHPDVIQRAEALMADRGYDSAENNRVLWEEYGISPIIDKRKFWKDGEGTKPLNEDKVDTIVYAESSHLH